MTDAQDRDIALERLATFAQPDVEPTLTYQELEDILDRTRRAVRWSASTVYAVGDVVIPTVSNDHRYRVTTGGTSAATEPAWGVSGTTTSGPVVLEEAGLAYSSVYDIRSALRECWVLKAAKASELISSSDSGSEQMIFEQCQKMAASYATPIIA